MTVPAFTAEQLAWLSTFPGPIKRALADVAPITDAQNTAAYSLLTADQRKAIDDKIAMDAAQAQVDAAAAALASAQAQVAAATEAAAGTGADISALS